MDKYTLVCDYQNADTKICSWEDSILVPKSCNNQLPAPVKPYSRKMFLASKKRSNRQTIFTNFQTCEDRNKQNNGLQGTRRYGEGSTFNRYKLKIQNLDREMDRWQDVSHKKIEEEDLRGYKRAQSGVINNIVEDKGGEHLLFEKRKYLSKSIEHNYHKETARVRPMSCRREGNNKEMLLTNRFREKAKSIHSKTSLRREEMKKKRSEGVQFSNLTINQLDAGKVKQILRCLSQRN